MAAVLLTRHVVAAVVRASGISVPRVDGCLPDLRGHLLPRNFECLTLADQLLDVVLQRDVLLRFHRRRGSDAFAREETERVSLAAGGGICHGRGGGGRGRALADEAAPDAPIGRLPSGAGRGRGRRDIDRVMATCSSGGVKALMAASERKGRKSCSRGTFVPAGKVLVNAAKEGIPGPISSVADTAAWVLT